MLIKNNIEKLRQELAPWKAKLIAVGKSHPAEKIQEAYEGGHRIFGENKVQEMTEKHSRLPPDTRWHFIGHLQRNKVKLMAPYVALVHAVDSLRLLEEINKEGEKAGRIIPTLLQVYIAREETKFGLAFDELDQLIRSAPLAQLKSVTIEGLMGMATLTDNQAQIKMEFKSLRAKFEELSKDKSLPPSIRMSELSMGMSSDYRLALEEGSTMVRIGTAIFGERAYKTI